MVEIGRDDLLREATVANKRKAAAKIEAAKKAKRKAKALIKAATKGKSKTTKKKKKGAL